MMKRIGTLAMVLGCLVATQVTTGCTKKTTTTTTKTNNTNNSNNNGGGGDVKPPDHSIGAACATGTTEQGDCDAGLVCGVGDSVPGNICTKTCQTDADCGATNACLGAQAAQGTTPAQPGSCYRMCDSAVVGSCNRDGYICQPTSLDGMGVCIADCNTLPNKECGAGLTCNASNGRCEGTQDSFAPCSNGDTGSLYCKNLGDLCLTFQAGAATGNCFPVGCVDNCAANAGAACLGVSFQSASDCTADAQCESPLVCDTGAANSSNKCILPVCAATCTPGPTASCPAGTTCTSLGNNQGLCLK